MLRRHSRTAKNFSTVTGVGLVTDTLGITKNAEDASTLFQGPVANDTFMKTCSERYSHFMIFYCP